MADYLVPSGTGESEYSEKRSTFLGHLKPVKTEDEAREFITLMKKTYHDARHNCWCYIIHNGAERYSDDGEPQGTAGIPMLEVFRKEGVSDFVCVVTRYFGGVLLGAGGLLRAYTKAAKSALDAAGITEIVPQQSGEITCPYSLAERIKAEIIAFGGTVEDITYSDKVAVKFLMPLGRYDDFSARIFDLSAGTVKLPIYQA